MKSNVKKYLLIILVGLVSFVLVMELARTSRQGTHQTQDYTQFTAGEDTLKCTIFLPSHAGARASYHYELLKRFANLNHYKLHYVPVSDSDKIWDQLLTHQTDLLVLNIIHDSIPKNVFNKVFLTPSITDMGEVWVSAKSRSPWRLEIVHWLTLFTQQKNYNRFQSRFFPASPNRCPYDSILRVTTRSLGWDWRIIRSVMYQESRYGMNALSSRNAIGLMQMKYSTAQDIDDSEDLDLFDPEQNIKCAVNYFSYLIRNMSLDQLPYEEQINFVLGAYNAGLGRIQENRDNALEDGKDPNKWADVAPYTPNQTQKYVEAVCNRYNSWVTSSE